MRSAPNRKRGLDLAGVRCETFADRFWSKVDPSGDCWLWTAHIKPQGYGQFTVAKGRFYGAHQVAYVLVRGPIEAGLSVCHRCDNPPCVNPDHLFLGTQSDNAFDMLAKGRARRVRGTDHPSARLTEADVRAIRAAPAFPGRNKTLAARYGVSTRAIWCVITGATWAHVDGPVGHSPMRGAPQALNQSNAAQAPESLQDGSARATRPTVALESLSGPLRAVPALSASDTDDVR